MKQNYSANTIKQLFSQYFPEKEIVTFFLCDGGVENSNFLISDIDGNKYVLKIFESSRNETDIVTSEISIMNELRQKNIAVPRIFLSKNSDFITRGSDNKIVILMEYVNGTKYTSLTLTQDGFTQVGQSIAQMQKVLESLELQKYAVPETHSFDLKYIFREISLRNIIIPYFDESYRQSVWKDIDRMSSLFLDLPCQIIHNDLNCGNIIFQSGEPYFIDFSDLVVSPRIQDVAIFLTRWCFTKSFNTENMKKFLLAYGEYFPLSQEEKKCLFVCIEARMLNIILTPYLEPDIGDFESLKAYLLGSCKDLQIFHAFGEENFYKLIS